MDVPPFPQFLAEVSAAATLFLRVISEDLEEFLVPPFPTECLVTAVLLLLRVLDSASNVPIHAIIRDHYPSSRQDREELWPRLAEDPATFWQMTGETPRSLETVVHRLTDNIRRYIRNPRTPRPRYRDTRPPQLSVRDRLLMLFVWLRSYPTFSILGSFFGVCEATAAETVHTLLLIAVSRFERLYVQWHSQRAWNNMRGTVPHFPNVVGIIDATPIRVNRPSGNLQRLYYRRDRGFHFMNWQVIVDCRGYFVFGQAGFLGHMTDAASYNMLPNIGYNGDLSIPRNTYFMADSGYPTGYPLLVPFSRRGGRYLTLEMRVYNRLLSRYRVHVEHRIHDLKIYRCMSGRFRHRRWRMCAVANMVMAMVNRRQRLIKNMRARF